MDIVSGKVPTGKFPVIFATPTHVDKNLDI